MKLCSKFSHQIENDTVMTKSTMIMLVFGVLIVLYLSLLLWSVVRQQKKMEAFAEKLEGEKSTVKHEEDFAEQQLERNLTIINAFEEIYDRKITPEELKEISDLLKDEKVLGATLVKKTVETYKKEKESAHTVVATDSKKTQAAVAEHFVELADISNRLSNFVQKLQKHASTPDQKLDVKTPAVPTTETFVQGNEPSSHLNKYMLLY